MRRKNPDTSLAAFKSLQSEEMIKTYNDILAALSVLGEGTTEEVESDEMPSQKGVEAFFGTS